MQSCVRFSLSVLYINKIKEHPGTDIPKPEMSLGGALSQQIQKSIRGIIQQLIPEKGTATAQKVEKSYSRSKVSKRILQAFIASGMVASAGGCMNIPDLPASAFAVLQEDGKLTKKRTCTSYIHFFQKDGKYYSLPGILTKKDTLPTNGEPHDIRDLSVVGEKVFPNPLGEADAWSLLQQFREKSLQLGTVSPYAFHLQGEAAIVAVQHEILTKLYTELQQRFSETMYDCIDSKPRGAYHQFFVEQFANYHGLYASIDERLEDASGSTDSLHVELVIGRKDGDAVLDFTTPTVAIQEGGLQEKILEETRLATATLDKTIARIPALQRILKKPAALRMRSIVDVQKGTGTGGLYTGGIVIYDHPESNNRWRLSTIFHELVHAYDDQKKDEVLPPEEVIVAGEDIQQIQKTTERNEFVARAVEVFHHKEHSSAEERRLWIWDQLALQKKEDRYRPFRLAVVKFTERYIAERRKDPLFAQATSENPMTYEWFSMYGEEEYWELLGAYMEKLIAQIPTEVDVRK